MTIGNGRVDTFANNASTIRILLITGDFCTIGSEVLNKRIRNNSEYANTDIRWNGISC